MPNNRGQSLEETVPLTKDTPTSRSSIDSLASSVSSASTTSLILERLNEQPPAAKLESRYKDEEQDSSSSPREPLDIEDGTKYYPGGARPVDMRARRALWIMALICLAGWLLALGLFLVRGDYKHVSTRPHDPMATATRGSGKRVTLESVMSGQWRPRKQGISWIAGPDGEDGLLLERGVPGKPFLVVEDVQNLGKTTLSEKARVLMKKQGFMVGDNFIAPDDLWPSPDLKKVLIRSATIKNWRHSSTGLFWIFDVETQTGEPLDPSNPNSHVQLAQWSPKSDAIAFTRDNNVYLRKLDFSKTTVQITKDGGPELFYGVPDWVYEEEVFAGSSATWWSDNGNYLAFLRTNESEVPTFPVQYFLSRPTGIDPKPGEEAYPDVRDIKYPKAGAPNPTVNIQFYDIDKMDVFFVDISDDFEDDTRLITEVVWAGSTNTVLVRETNRESDLLKMILIDVVSRSGKTVRELDVAGLDGGWMEVSQDTTFIPADPANGREHDGYIDTVIHKGFDHLGYFTPLDNPEPVLLTQGDWEVVNAPSSVDLKNNLVYFVATKEGSTQRHVYNTKLDGTSISSVSDTKSEAYYGVSFSTGAGYALLSYDGPSIPWQKLINTPSNPTKFSLQIEDNAELEQLARRHNLPIESYSTVDIGNGVSVNVLERLPPHFDKKRKYPVLVQQYSGPGSQSVDRRFTIDFQSYIASSLNYIVLTVDPRGTGFRGRDFRCVTRGNLGVTEATDHIALARLWGQKKYVDESRMAIWGWSYGGFETLKTLELDGGGTFQYGMAVAPVTDWRFYDSIYTERYMHTPQNNNRGYNNASIHDVARLSGNVRFLVMHGVADDNVHTQNTYTLLDHLDVGGVENYDVHVFPDSDHGIYFHNANRIVYDKLSSWLVNAFNGEWLRVDSPVPKGPSDDKRAATRSRNS